MQIETILKNTSLILAIVFAFAIQPSVVRADDSAEIKELEQRIEDAVVRADLKF